MCRMVLLLGLMGQLLLLGFVLTGCSVGEPPEAELPPIKRKQEVKTPTPETLFAKAEEDAYTYRSSGRRDPFKPLIAPKKPVAALEENKVECPPLQEFEIPSLKLVGIVWGQMGRKAMLKAPNGRGYSIVENARVGRHCARVLRIESNAVIMEETRRDADGNVSKEEVILRLKEREG